MRWDKKQLFRKVIIMEAARQKPIERPRNLGKRIDEELDQIGFFAETGLSKREWRALIKLLNP